MAYGGEGVARKSIKNIQEFGTHMFIHKQKTIAMRQAYFTTRAKGQNFLGYVQRRQKNVYILGTPLISYASVVLQYFTKTFISAVALARLPRQKSFRPRSWIDMHSFVFIVYCLRQRSWISMHLSVFMVFHLFSRVVTDMHFMEFIAQFTSLIHK